MRIKALLCAAVLFLASPAHAVTAGDVAEFCAQDSADMVKTLRFVKDAGMPIAEAVARYRGFAATTEAPEAWVEDTVLLIEAVYAADEGVEGAVKAGQLGSKYYEHCVEFNSKHVGEPQL